MEDVWKYVRYCCYFGGFGCVAVSLMLVGYLIFKKEKVTQKEYASMVLVACLVAVLLIVFMWLAKNVINNDLVANTADAKKALDNSCIVNNS